MWRHSQEDARAKEEQSRFKILKTPTPPGMVPSGIAEWMIKDYEERYKDRKNVLVSDEHPVGSQMVR